MEIIDRGGVRFLEGERFSSKGIIHGFSLRQGGVSKGEFESLNVGLRRGDDIQNARKNIQIAGNALGLAMENLTLTYQTHTNNVRFLRAEDIGKGLVKEWDGEGVDGIVTDMKNVPLMCYSADCVPLLLYDPVREMIGAVHSGWRGTAGKIAKNAVGLMEEHGCEAKNITALIGPAIGMCCYEVSRDVGEVFSGEYPEFARKKADGKYMLDLKEIVREQLRESGLERENVENSLVCTSCRNDLFFSHRAQGGKSGLLGGFIQLI